MNPRLFRVLTPAVAGVFVAALLLLAGCASPQLHGLPQHWPADLAQRMELPKVAYFAQEDNECGPAALAMLLQTAGVHVLPEQLVDQVYLPGRKGSLQVELLAASRRYGVPAYALKPEMEALLREVAAGNPVLVLQNLSLPIYPVWHYAVVIGFDRARNVVLLHSGRTERLELSFYTFEKTWARSGSWSMVALAPERVPATADPESFAQSLAALERVQPAAAGTGYAAALQRWPAHATLLLGAGNSAYALGDLPAAQSAFSAAVAAHPDFGDAWNNLAQVLLDQGQLPQAREAIARAVALGGERLALYLQLQSKMEAGALGQ